MTIDENAFVESVKEWGRHFKFLSPDKVIELLKASEVSMERTVCPRCHGIYLARVEQCPLCGYRRNI